MRRGLITVAVVLGLGGLTFALTQPGTVPSQQPRPTKAVAPPEPACDGVETDQDNLHARVAKLRAEIELLQLEHDALRTSLSGWLQDREAANAEIAGPLDAARVAAHYMRMGAESVGKADEFDRKAQADRAELEKELEVAVAKADEDRTVLKSTKAEFLRLATELNRKKIELVKLETKLEGSM